MKPPRSEGVRDRLSEPGFLSTCFLVRKFQESGALVFGVLLSGLLVSATAAGDIPDPAQQSLAEMEAIGAAMASWLTDQASLGGLSKFGDLPDLWDLGGRQERGGSFDLGSYPVISHGNLEALLVPTYLPSVPETDGWGNPYDFRLETADFSSLEALAIRSLGADGLAEGDLYSPGYTSQESEDLVWARALFVRLPQPSAEEAQAATMALLRTLGAALLSWFTDVVGVTGQGDSSRALSVGEGPAFDLGLYVPRTHGELSTLLVPVYLPFVPELDGWGNPFEFYVDVMDPLGPAPLALRSAGSDGVTSGDLYTPGGFPFSLEEEDIVWADGVFIRFPEGGRVFADGFESGDVCEWSFSAPP